MKCRLIKNNILLFILIILMLCSCKNNSDLIFTHYASGGLKEDMELDIIFEQYCSTFTAYQVAFSSCTCRDNLTNYKSICYVEILNTKKNKEDASIRYITFGENKGLWGDSNPNYYKPEYTEKYYDENLVKPLIGITKKEIETFNDYGDLVDVLNVDALTGATVSYSNIQSMLKKLFEYHTKKYYK